MVWSWTLPVMGVVALWLITFSFLSIVHGVEPDFTRDGCSIPVTLALQNALQKNIVLLPIGACDDGAHSQNEKINRVNYIQGVSCARPLITVCPFWWSYGNWGTSHLVLKLISKFPML